MAIRRKVLMYPFIWMMVAPCAAAEVGWKTQLQRQLPILGHRNWIVVADSAYPSQTAPGIKTIYAGGSHLDAVKHVLRKVREAKHVNPVLLIDKELDYVPEEYANGIREFRAELKKILGKQSFQATKHEEIIEQLDKAGQSFHVLVIKTDLTLPYTSVFIRLDAGYWSDNAESKLREALKKGMKDE